MAIRSRGSEGNLRVGPEVVLGPIFKPGHSIAVAAAPAASAIKILRVVSGKVTPV